MLKPALPAVLAFELLPGGQARLTSAITPRIHKRAMAKAVSQRDNLRFIPIRNPTARARFIGGLMCLASGLVAWPGTRVPYGAAPTLLLTTMGVYSQAKAGISYR
jgi:hypothetical protein